MFDGTDSFYIVESDIHYTMPSTTGPQVASTISTLLHSQDETDSYENSELKDLQSHGYFKTVCFGVVLYNKTKCKVEQWTLTKRRIRWWWQWKLVAQTNRPSEKGSRWKNNITAQATLD